MEPLTINDLGFLLESLSYTRMAFENYAGYPSYEFKLQRLQEEEDLRHKLQAMRRELKRRQKEEHHENPA